MPVGETLVDDGVDAHRLTRIGDVEDDAVTRTRTRGHVRVREHGDVVALVGLPGFLGLVAVIATAPETGKRAGLGIGKHGRRIDDARTRRIVHGNLDDIDTEQRRALVAGQVVETGFHFFLFANARGARVVDNDLAVLAGSAHDRVRVRAATGLHHADLLRIGQVADIENADAAEALWAHVLRHALEAAIQSAAGFLHRHDQQVADDRNVALATRADDRGHQLRHAIVLQLINVKAVVVAGNQHVAGKSHVGVGEAQHR